MSSLKGIAILDLSRLLPGPACSWYLSGLGASVDRVEPLGQGDRTRTLPPFVDGVGAFFSALNAGDRSLALDLRHGEAPTVLRALLGRYDVLIESFRPGVLEALGLDDETLERDFPRLVVARISGFGQTGPWSQRPGHDLNYQGLAGTAVQGALSEDCPHVPGVQSADLGGALTAALGIAAALYEREQTGRGRIVDVSLTHAALSMIAPQVAISTAQGRPTSPGGEMLTGGVPTYGTYRCKDGKWLTLGSLEPKFQAELARHVSGLTAEEIRASLLTKERDEWVELLSQACAAPALDTTEIAAHPAHRGQGTVDEVDGTTFVRPPLSPPEYRRGPVAGLGEHTRAILVESGLTPQQIADLRAARVVG